MRFVLYPAGSTGDVLPFAGLAQELVARGHDVVVLGSGAHREFLEATGAEYVEVVSAEEYHEAISDPDAFHPRRGIGIVMGWLSRLMGRGFDLLEQVWEPDSTLVAHTIAFDARTFEEARGIRAATVHLAPSSLRSLHRMTAFRPGSYGAWMPMWLRRALWWLIDRRLLDPHLAPALNAHRARYGLPPVQRIWRNWLNSPQLVIGLFPEWFGRIQPDWPPQLQLTSFPLHDGGGTRALSAEVTAWLDAGEPPVLVTGGTPNPDARPFLDAALQAARACGRRALLAAGRVRFDELDPAHALAAEYVPFSTAMPRCAAAIHHGGIGTTSQALAAGIPQVITPFSFDQPDNITRVMELGAGLPAKVDRRGASMARALGAVLGDPRAGAAARVARDNLQGRSGIAMACDLLERHAASPPPPPLRGAPA